MATYYYLMSSLPYLKFVGSPPLAFADLEEMCSPWLGPRDRAEFERARIDVENVESAAIRSRTLRHWYAFEHSLRNELVKMRSRRLGVSPDPHLRKDPGEDPELTESVEDLVEGLSPLNAEIELLRLRWDFLVGREWACDFDLNELIIYSLKLQLLERLSKFEAERGREVLDGIYERALGGTR